ncbi:MAG: LmeA family phospholipid-binding protein [Anaerolineae bacterium]|nr:LmeA family phospholipid-binding protein [Anaerolineae bacterium]
MASAAARRGAFSLTITDQELTSYVIGLLQSGQGEFPARDMQILFREGYVEIWATFIEIAPTDVPAYVRATVQARDGQLDLAIHEANGGPFPVPGAMRELLSRILSESLAELGLALSIDEVVVSPGEMTIRGEVTGALPALP